MKKGEATIGKKTSKLLSALEGKNLSQPHFHIIAHPELNDRNNSQRELDQLEDRGLARKFHQNGQILYTLTDLGQLLLTEYRKWS